MWQVVRGQEDPSRNMDEGQGRHGHRNGVCGGHGRGLGPAASRNQEAYSDAGAQAPGGRGHPSVSPVQMFWVKWGSFSATLVAFKLRQQ